MRRGGGESVYAALQRWLNGPVEGIGITRPADPEFRGALTIRYAYDTKDGAAYGSQQALARGWGRRAPGVRRAQNDVGQRT